MLRFIRFLGLLISFGASAGYLNISNSEMQRRLRLLDYDKNFEVKNTKRYRIKRHYNIYKVKLESIHPWSKTKMETNFFYYKSKEEGPRPLMIIVPPIVDITPLDKAMAHVFVTKGYNVLILKYNEQINDYERPLKDFNRALVSIITSGRLLIDWAEKQEEIDATKIGSYGMSLGALILSVYVGVEDRIDAAIIIVGGGHIPHLLPTSQQNIASAFKDARMKAEGIKTDKEFQKILEDIIIFDPMTFSSRRDRKDIYMVIGDNDSAVATKNQWMLWNAYGKPEHVSYTAEHFPSILQNLTKHDLIFDFLQKRLDREEERMSRHPRGGFTTSFFNF